MRDLTVFVDANDAALALTVAICFVAVDVNVAVLVLRVADSFVAVVATIAVSSGLVAVASF